PERVVHCDRRTRHRSRSGATVRICRRDGSQAVGRTGHASRVCAAENRPPGTVAEPLALVPPGRSGDRHPVGWGDPGWIDYLDVLLLGARTIRTVSDRELLGLADLGSARIACAAR